MTPCGCWRTTRLGGGIVEMLVLAKVAREYKAKQRKVDTKTGLSTASRNVLVNTDNNTGWFSYRCTDGTAMVTMSRAICVTCESHCVFKKHKKTLYILYICLYSVQRPLLPKRMKYYSRRASRRSSALADQIVDEIKILTNGGIISVRYDS